jgi:hypothetical protein
MISDTNNSRALQKQLCASSWGLQSETFLVCILTLEKAIKLDKPAVMLKWGRREKKDQGGKSCQCQRARMMMTCGSTFQNLVNNCMCLIHC